MEVLKPAYRVPVLKIMLSLLIFCSAGIQTGNCAVPSYRMFQCLAMLGKLSGVRRLEMFGWNGKVDAIRKNGDSRINQARDHLDTLDRYYGGSDPLALASYRGPDFGVILTAAENRDTSNLTSALIDLTRGLESPRIEIRTVAIEGIEAALGHLEKLSYWQLNYFDRSLLLRVSTVLRQADALEPTRKAALEDRISKMLELQKAALASNIASLDKLGLQVIATDQKHTQYGDDHRVSYRGWYSLTYREIEEKEAKQICGVLKYLQSLEYWNNDKFDDSIFVTLSNRIASLAYLDPAIRKDIKKRIADILGHHDLQTTQTN